MGRSRRYLQERGKRAPALDAVASEHRRARGGTFSKGRARAGHSQLGWFHRKYAGWAGGDRPSGADGKPDRRHVIERWFWLVAGERPCNPRPRCGWHMFV